jgi:hypothetical protein
VEHFETIAYLVLSEIGASYMKECTRSPCFLSQFLKPFCFNIHCLYAPRLNLRTLFCGLTNFGWLCSIQGRGERIWAPVKKERTSPHTARADG